MRIIEIAPLENGAHRNQEINGAVTPPEGWAVIPPDIPIPDSFPFVGVEAENGVVTALTPGEMPAPAPEPPQTQDRYTAEDMIKAALTM